MRPILIAPNDALRRVAEPVDLNRLDHRVGKELRSAIGRALGLAAPQLDIPVRVIAARLAGDDVPVVLVNPIIKALGGPRATSWEGCLSLPGVACLVPRYARVTVDYFDPDLGMWQHVELRGRDAVVVQHEIDHLDGRLMTDRARNTRKSK